MNKLNEVDEIKSDIDKELDELGQAWKNFVLASSSFAPPEKRYKVIVELFGLGCKNLDEIFVSRDIIDEPAKPIYTMKRPDK